VSELNRGHASGWSANPDGSWDAFHGGTSAHGTAEDERAAEREAQDWVGRQRQGDIRHWIANHDDQVRRKQYASGRLGAALRALREIEDLCSHGGPMCSDPMRELAKIARQGMAEPQQEA